MSSAEKGQCDTVKKCADSKDVDINGHHEKVSRTFEDNDMLDVIVFFLLPNINRARCARFVWSKVLVACVSHECNEVIHEGHSCPAVAQHSA